MSDSVVCEKHDLERPRQTKNGKRTYCNACAKEYRERPENRAKALARSKIWREQNPDKVKENNKSWRERNLDSVKERNKSNYEANREKRKEYAAKRRRDHPETVRKSRNDSAKRRKFGVEPEDFQRMLAEQNGVCAACGEGETSIEYRTGKVRALAIDHNHKTGAVRALLCRACNLTVGNAKEDPHRLRQCATYLERF